MIHIEEEAPTRAHGPLKIGVFDSGFGGLTVLRELLRLIPEADSIYLGDTARLPYGSKSRETISRYAVSSAGFLKQQGADLLVIACNTATALALEDIQASMPIPVIGVVEPGAAAVKAESHALTGARAGEVSLRLTPPGGALVLATAATVQSGAYTKALQAVSVEVHEKACPLLVPLVEEGWTDHPVTDEVLGIYLAEALEAAPLATTLLLGCTHYPLIQPAIRRALDRLGYALKIVDSAHATARATKLLVEKRFGPLLQETGRTPERLFYATDSVEKFRRLGTQFLGQPIDEVRLVDLGG